MKGIGKVFKERKVKLLIFMLVAAILMPGNAVFASPTGSEGKANVTAEKSKQSPQRVIVTTKNQAGRSAAIQKNGSLKRQLTRASSAAMILTEEEIDELKKDPNILSVEPDGIVQVTAQTADWGIPVVQATYAWSNGFGGNGVKIAVLDTGIAAHEDLSIAGGSVFVDYTASYEDDHGHGTHVAGIIGSLDNDKGTVGVAPESQLYAVKVLDGSGKGYVSDVTAGIEWAIDNEMDIINLSISAPWDSTALRQAIADAEENGVIVVASAGNNGQDAGVGETVVYPAQYQSVVSVGAVGEDLTRTAFSSTGQALKVVAPGQGITSTTLGNGYATMSGTSMAAAYTTGILALLKQEHPELSAIELKGILYANAVDLGAAGKDPRYGYGLVNTQTVKGSVYGWDTPDPSVTGSVYYQDMLMTAAGAEKVVTYKNFYPKLHNNVDMYLMGMSTLQDGRVFLTGGFGGTSTTSNYTSFYNPKDNTLTNGPALPFSGGGHGQVTLTDGRVFIQHFGSYIFNPSTNQYSSVANIPHGANQYKLSPLADGRVFVIHSYNYSVNSFLPNEAYIYNPVNNLWVQAASLPIGLQVQSTSTLLDGRIMIIAINNNYQPRVYLYDPALNSWTEKKSLPERITSNNQVTLKDGRVAIAGGYSMDTEQYKSIYYYHPDTDTWTVSTLTLPNRVSNPSATLLNDGRMMLLSGYGDYTFRDMHLFTFNHLPQVTVTNASQTIYPITGSPIITLTGTVKDPDSDFMTINAAINGVTKSTVIASTPTGAVWQLQWNAVTDNIPHGIYSNILITTTDGQYTANASYTAALTVDYNQPPYVPVILSPLSGNAQMPALISPAGTVYQWSFTDPDAGDRQTAYEVVFYTGDTAVYSTGWVSSGLTSYSNPPITFSAGTTYNWRVRVRDSKGGISAFSSPSYIRLNSVPVAQFTAYADGQQLDDNILTFTWNYTDSDNQAQAAYQIVGSKDNWATISYNTGALSSATARSHTTPGLADGTWSFYIMVSDGIVWSNKAYRSNLQLPNGFEPNDSPETAFSIGYDTLLNSRISSATDVDFYTYTATSDGIDRLTLTVPQNKNYDVLIYDSAWNLVGSGIRGPGLTEDVLYMAKAGSTYFIRIHGSNGDFDSGLYTLKVIRFGTQTTTQYHYDSNGNLQSKTTTSH